MADLRTVLAAVLGVGLGLVLLAFPSAVIRVQTVGRLPDDRGGPYGEPADAPASWRWVVRGVGMAFLLAGISISAEAIGILH
jgi:hypothetical protein